VILGRIERLLRNHALIYVINRLNSPIESLANERFGPGEIRWLMKRWVASFERMLDLNEKGQANPLEKEFQEWAKTKLTQQYGFYVSDAESFKDRLG